ncbi:MAG: hypothetical protein JRI68_10310 [Deltaproteobacteria bacterium]|nr:hypothetical protein [Deltaproteobacteria bacterium]
MNRALLGVAAVGLFVGGFGCPPKSDSGSTERAGPATSASGSDGGQLDAPLRAEPVALFTGADTQGKRALFQLSPRSGEPTAVAGLGNLAVASAVVSPSGTAGVFVLTTEGGDRQLWRARLSPPAAFERVAKAPAGITQARAVSVDGKTVVVELVGGELAILRRGAVGRGSDGERTDQTIPTGDLGLLRYGVGLSADGSKLAFSVMGSGCGSSTKTMGTCPVALYAVDLKTGYGKPRRLVDEQIAVAYDPELTGDGERVTFMTTAGDDSAACRKHVNHCTYRIHQVPFAGGKSERLVVDAVHARRAADGTLSYRRRVQSSETGEPRRDWSRQSLFIVEQPGKPRPLARETVWHWVHHWSPDSRWIALQQRRRDAHFFDVIDRRGKPTREGVAGAMLRAVGWSVAPLKAGTRRLSAPAPVRALQHAVDRASKQAGSRSALATFGLGDYLHDKAALGLDPLSDGAAVTAWLGRSDTHLVIADRDEYCRQHRSGLVGVELATKVSDGLVLLQKARDGKPPPAAPDGPPLARFDMPGPKGGIVELVGVTLPPRARLLERASMTLLWRVIEPPSASWKVFVHVDGKRSRILGDHVPGACGISGWKAGDVVADTFEVEISSASMALVPGRYQVLVGWFFGTQRAQVSSDTLSHAGERLTVGGIQIEAAD